MARGLARRVPAPCNVVERDNRGNTRSGTQCSARMTSTFSSMRVREGRWHPVEVEDRAAAVRGSTWRRYGCHSSTSRPSPRTPRTSSRSHGRGPSRSGDERLPRRRAALPPVEPTAGEPRRIASERWARQRAIAFAPSWTLRGRDAVPTTQAHDAIQLQHTYRRSRPSGSRRDRREGRRRDPFLAWTGSRRSCARPPSGP